MLNPFVDCGLELRDVVENTSPYTLSGDFGEEPLDEVEPGARRRREMQDEAFVSRQPAFHGRCFVGGVVVEDQMQIEMGGGLAINQSGGSRMVSINQGNVVRRSVSIGRLFPIKLAGNCMAFPGACHSRRSQIPQEFSDFQETCRNCLRFTVAS
jgi:hypothetical protein